MELFQVLVAQSAYSFRVDRCIYRGMEFHFACSALECVQRMKKEHYDALVFQMELSENGMVHANTVFKTAAENHTSIFCISKHIDDEMMKLLFSFQIKYYFLGEVSFQEICDKLCEVKGLVENSNLWKRAAGLLHTLGIPNSVQGYNYILGSIVSCYYDEEYLKGITKRLYPMLASEYKTTAYAVEKSIRHAIEMAFSHSDHNFLYDFFKGTIRSDKAKATNSQFISMCVEYIKTEGL